MPQLREPEVDQHEPRTPLAAREHDVLGLDVAMEDIACVCVRECRKQIARDRDCIAGRQPAFTAQHGCERRPLDELHRQVLVRRGVSVIENAHAAGMIEPSGARGLALEPRDQRRCRELGVEHLQRDHALEPDMLGAIDDAHAAARERRDDPIAACEDGPGG